MEYGHLVLGCSACDPQAVCGEEVIIHEFFANFVACVGMVACEEPLPKHLVTHLPGACGRQPDRTSVTQGDQEDADQEGR